MRFGLLYEHQLPRPWQPDSEHRLLKNALEQVELADRVGFDYVWEVEHHFLEEYSHSSASDVFLAACSQRTKNIRLGFGILPLPAGYQHPARVAETVATLDLISDGRVDFGSGETSSGAELAGFGVDRETKREQWDEMLDVVTRMFVEEPFAGHEGQFLSMPPRNVIPKPLQRPHPPLWVACSRRETILTAAEKGLGALSFAFVEPEEAKGWVDEYHAILASEKCVPAGFAVNPQFAIALPMMMHPDEAEAIERGIDGAHFFGYALAHHYVFGDHRPGRTNIWQEFQQRRDQVGFAREIVLPDDAPLGVKLLQQGLGALRGAVGTPAQVRELVQRYEAAGVDQMIFVLQAGNNKHEHICEAIELFASEVMPEFHERAPKHEAAKRERLAPAVAAALARRPPRHTAPVDHRINPSDSGPAHASQGARAAAAETVAAAVKPGAWRKVAEKRGEAAFRAFVKRSDDRRLERTVGSSAGLKVIFGGMERQFAPEHAVGFNGDIRYELTSMSGAKSPWTVSIGGGQAKARPGASDAPKLTLKLALADFIRVAAGDADPGRLLLNGKLDIEGDFEVAARMADMFGQPSVY